MVASGGARALLLAAALGCVLAVAHGWNYRAGGVDWSSGNCGDGMQSPVNIRNPPNAGGTDSVELDLHYPVVQSWYAGMKVEHTGTDIQLSARHDNLGFAYFHGHKFHVREVLFKAPSEHRIRGKSFDMEVQIIHQKHTGDGDSLFVVSALYTAKANSTRRSAAFLDDALMWRDLPSAPGKRTLLTKPFQLGLAFDGLHNGYYQYTGSLTKPPCTTGVTWNVLETIQEATPDQIFRINQLFRGNYTFAKGRGNNREVRKLQGRAVTLHNHKPVGDGDGLPIPVSEETPEHPQEKDASGIAPEDEPEEDEEHHNRTSTRRKRTLPALYAKGGADWQALCRTGRMQSPIDVKLAVGNPHGDWEMMVNYLPAKPRRGLENVGWTLLSRGNFGSLYVEGEKQPYVARRILFHAPSEHTIDGRRAALELEILHVQGKGPAAKRAILSVLFHESIADHSDFLDSLSWRMLPFAKDQFVRLPDGINLSLLHGLRDGYYSYAGSLSQPPCTEGVKRFVLRTINPASTWQLGRFRRIFYGNNRPLQSSNRRGVTSLGFNIAKDALPKYANQPPHVLRDY